MVDKLSFAFLAETTPTCVENLASGRGSRDGHSVTKFDPYIDVDRSINLPRVVIRATGGQPNLEPSTTDTD